MNLIDWFSVSYYKQTFFYNSKKTGYATVSYCSAYTYCSSPFFSVKIILKKIIKFNTPRGLLVMEDAGENECLHGRKRLGPAMPEPVKTAA